METLSSLKIQSWLTWFLRGMLIFGFLILAARLVDLSIIRGNYFRSLAEGNRIRRFPIVAPRGNIFAGGGELIVGNKEVKLHLTFDSESGYQKLKDVEGVNDNEIINLYSSPSYDPNVFVSNDADKISQLLNDPDLPLFDRVISGKFHPGSVYKPLVVISALEEVVIDEDYTYEDTGQIVISTPYGNFSYKNWYFTQYGGVEGKIGLERALTRSTDTFFYKLGELTGVEKLTDWSNRFGLDQKTGVDLPGEIPGFVPSPEWKIKEKGERWFLGNTYHMSIGQGDLALTPIGINNYIATIASDAKHCKPKIINKEETNYFLNKFKSSDTQDFQCEDMDINKDSLNLVKKGMMGACASGGTGFTFFAFV